MIQSTSTNDIKLETKVSGVNLSLPTFNITYNKDWKEQDLLRHLQQLEDAGLFKEKRFNFRFKDQVAYYNRDNKTLILFSQKLHPRDLVQTGQTITEMTNAVMELSQDTKLTSMIKDRLPRCIQVLPVGASISLPYQDNILIFTAALYELSPSVSVYYDTGVAIQNQGSSNYKVINWTRKSAQGFRGSGDTWVTLQGKKTLTQGVLLDGSFTGKLAVRFAAYDSKELHRWGSTRKPFTLLVHPNGKIYLAPVSLERAKIGCNSGCVAALIKVANGTLHFQPCCFPFQGREDSSDSSEMRNKTMEALRSI